MPEFTYEAMATNGTRKQGTLNAASEREVMAMLDSQGLFPMQIAAAKGATRSFSWGGKSVRSRFMATFYSQLADLLHSGVPLLRSLDILERQSSQPTLKEVLRDVRSKVADGTGLAQAMSDYPRVFNELAVSMIRAGQEGGFLEDVLKRIADFTEHQEDLKARVTGALAYPLFLAFAGTVVLLILVFGVLPQFAPIFAKLEEKGQLPTLTKVVLGLSTNWWICIPLVGGVVGAILWMRSNGARSRVDRWRLRVPLLGNVFLSYALARFTRILGTMLRNGIPILQALRVAKDSAGNTVLAEAIERSAVNITAGDRLATPLAACKYFPRDIVEMISVGEESNSLEKVLTDIAEGLEKRTTRQLDLFVRLLEPIMLLIMAVVIGVVVAALLMPIFRMGSTVGK